MKKAHAIQLRAIREGDCQIISDAFLEQGWAKPKAQYDNYLKRQALGEQDIIIATLDGIFAGYLTICWESGYLPFRRQGIPEIADLNVLAKYQRQGIATKLMDEAERRIQEKAAYAGIGFGITKDYGVAQRLYINRNYKPDGQGLAKNAQALAYGDQVTINDDLALYLTKKLHAPKASYIAKIRQKIGKDKIIYPGCRILIADENEDILFIERADNGNVGIPAGGIEEGETIEACIKREVLEETGLELLDVVLIGISTNPQKETVRYPNGDEVQYFTAEFYSNSWKGALNAGEEVIKLAFKSKENAQLLPENERGIFVSLAHYQQHKQVYLR